ncbi:MAG: hypothetical protein MJ059_09225 [Lachnospiraceae bacterium]|nr:hypothetical protein [Lachnospiraceae bacterium]
MNDAVKTPASITLCDDGKYRWAYELPMMKSMAILVTVWKVLGISMCVPYLIVLISGGFDDFFKITGVFLLILLGIIILSLLAYTIVAAMYGWKYCVIFEMDDEGLMHAQQPNQVKKGQAIGWIAALAGAGSGNLTLAGSGLLAATKNGQYSEFSKVRTIKAYPKQHLIKLDYLTSHNQVYVEDDAFEFVEDYIRSRCPDAR